MSTIERPPIRTEPPEPLRTNTATALLRELRPKQWTKNLLVLAGLVFSYNLRESGAIWKTVAAFVIFCAVSSASYVINDLADLEQDRRHPRKRLRPIASGAISEATGWAIAAVLLLVSLPVAWVLSPTFFGVVVVYFAIVQMYSYRLKHVVLLDVFAIAAGFVLRAVAGAVVIPVRLSPGCCCARCSPRSSWHSPSGGMSWCCLKRAPRAIGGSSTSTRPSSWTR